MKGNQFLLFILFTCRSIWVFAQAIPNESGRINNLGDAIFSKSVTEFRIDNPNLGIPSEKISYDKIKGSPFWQDEWRQAFLYSNTGYIATMPVRINLATGELHFLKDCI